MIHLTQASSRSNFHKATLGKVGVDVAELGVEHLWIRFKQPFPVHVVRHALPADSMATVAAPRGSGSCYAGLEVKSDASGMPSGSTTLHRQGVCLTVA